MKKLFLTITAITLGTLAQVYVQGGLNLANITKTNFGQTEKNNILPSFNAGILVDWNWIRCLTLNRAFY
jgi:hypothetical protein